MRQALAYIAIILALSLAYYFSPLVDHFIEQYIPRMERVVRMGRRAEMPKIKIVEVPKIIERRVEVPVERVVEKPVEKIVEKVVPVVVEKPVEKVVEKIVKVPSSTKPNNRAKNYPGLIPEREQTFRKIYTGVGFGIHRPACGLERVNEWRD